MGKIYSLALIVSYLFGNIYKFSLFSPDVRISLLDIVVFLIVVLNLRVITQAFKHESKLVQSIISFALIAFLSLIMVSERYGFTAQIVGLLYLLRWTAYSLLFLVLKKNPPPLVYLGIGMVILGLIQYLVIPDTRFLQVNNWDPHYYRVIGPLLDPGFTGIIYVFTLIYLTLNPFRNYLLNTFLWIASYSALALTYSRSSYFAFFVAMGVISAKRRNPTLIILVFLASLITLYVLPKPGGEGVKLERTSTIEARIINWKNSLAIINDHRVLGVGFNTYRYAQKEYGFIDSMGWLESHSAAGADSSVLFVTATTGILGLLFYSGYLLVLAKKPGTKYYLIPLLVHSLFLNSLFYPSVMLWLSLLVTTERKQFSIPS